MYDSKFTESNLLAYEVDVQLNVLSSSMMNRIGGHVDSRHVVTENNRGFGKGTVELAKQLSELDAIGDSVGHRTIFRLRTGS